MTLSGSAIFEQNFESEIDCCLDAPTFGRRWVFRDNDQLVSSAKNFADCRFILRLGFIWREQQFEINLRFGAGRNESMTDMPAMTGHENSLTVQHELFQFGSISFSAIVQAPCLSAQSRPGSPIPATACADSFVLLLFMGRADF